MKKRFIAANAIILAIALAYVIYDALANGRAPSGVALTAIAAVLFAIPAAAFVNTVLAFTVYKGTVNKKALFFTNAGVFLVMAVHVLISVTYHLQNNRVLSFPWWLHLLLIYLYLLVFAIANGVFLTVSRRKTKEG